MVKTAVVYIGWLPDANRAVGTKSVQSRYCRISPVSSQLFGRIFRNTHWETVVVRTEQMRQCLPGADEK